MKKYKIIFSGLILMLIVFTGIVLLDEKRKEKELAEYQEKHKIEIEDIETISPEETIEKIVSILNEDFPNVEIIDMELGNMRLETGYYRDVLMIRAESFPENKLDTESHAYSIAAKMVHSIVTKTDFDIEHFKFVFSGYDPIYSNTSSMKPVYTFYYDKDLVSAIKNESYAPGNDPLDYVKSILDDSSLQD